MARARNIKPGFWKNEDLAECTITARLLFVGLWMLADREGRLEDRPKRIKAELFAFDTFEVEPLLVELEQFGFIQRYAINGSRYIQVTKFAEHQTPHYTEKASTIPAPLQESCGIKPQRLQESGGDGDGGFPDHRDDEGGPAPRKIGPKPNMKGGSLPPDSLNPDSLNPDSSATAVSARARQPFDDDPPEAGGMPPTAYGAITRRLMAAGIARVNPGHLGFKALVDAGATAEDFLAYVPQTLDAKPRDPFKYLIGTLEGERRRVAEAGPIPAKPEDPMAWRKSLDGVQRRAGELGLSPRPGEMAHDFERRVLTAHQRAAGRQGAAA